MKINKSGVLFIASVVLMLVVSFAIIHYGALRDERYGIAHEPGATAQTECNGVAMTREECRIEAADEQLNELDFWYFALDNDVQWVIMYAVSGLAGAIAAYWLRLLGLGPTVPADKFSVPRLAVGAVGGATVALLVKLPGPLAARLLVHDFKVTGDLHSVYGSCLALAFMAGLFASVFFTKLQLNYKKD